MEGKRTFKTISEYISQAPLEVQEELKVLRKLIKEEAPEAEERISWQMPTFVLHGNLVHFALHKNHVGFYPGASGIDAFKDQLAGYKWSKGAIQFPIGKPIPYELIRDIVKFRVVENQKEAKDKKKK